MDIEQAHLGGAKAYLERSESAGRVESKALGFKSCHASNPLLRQNLSSQSTVGLLSPRRIAKRYERATPARSAAMISEIPSRSMARRMLTASTLLISGAPMLGRYWESSIAESSIEDRMA